MDAKILVVDDEEIMLVLTSGFLKSPRYDVTTAIDATTAIELMKSEEFDIIVTDKNLPGTDGNLEGGLEIMEYATQHLPESEVIMITGHATIETVITAMKLGAFDYVLKPLDRNEFIKKIDRIIEYQGFLDSSFAIGMHTQLQSHLLELLQKQQFNPQETVEDILTSFNKIIDTLFEAKKNRERVIIRQMESLAKVAGLSEQLKEQLPQDSECMALVDQLITESHVRF